MNRVAAKGLPGALLTCWDPSALETNEPKLLVNISGGKEILTSVAVVVTVVVETTVLTGQQLETGVGVFDTILVSTDELLRAGQSVIVGAQDVTV